MLPFTKCHKDNINDETKDNINNEPKESIQETKENERFWRYHYF